MNEQQIDQPEYDPEEESNSGQILVVVLLFGLMMCLTLAAIATAEALKLKYGG